MAGEDALFQRFGKEFKRGDVLFREGEPGKEIGLPSRCASNC